jgi:hypothetical protein
MLLVAVVELEDLPHNQEVLVVEQEIIIMDQEHFREELVFVVKVFQEDVLLRMELQVYLEEFRVLEVVEQVLQEEVNLDQLIHKVELQVVLVFQYVQLIQEHL